MKRVKTTAKKRGRPAVKKDVAPKKRGRPTKLSMLQKSMKRGRPRKSDAKLAVVKE